MDVLAFVVTKLVQHKISSFTASIVLRYLEAENFPFFIIFMMTGLLNFCVLFVFQEVKQLIKKYVFNIDDSEPEPVQEKTTTDPENRRFPYYHPREHLGAHRGSNSAPAYVPNPDFPVRYTRLWEYNFGLETIVEEDEPEE